MKNYLKSFFKHYLRRKPKLVITLILTVIIYIWISIILKDILSDPTFYSYSRKDPKLDHIKFDYIGQFASGLYILFIKPIFVYISGLIIIKKI